MRASRPATSAKPAAHSAKPAADVPDAASDGNLSAMQLLASAVHISGSRVVGGSMPARAVGAGLAPFDRPTVTGAAGGGSRAADHVGGGMSPPVANMVALSDGTRISFGAVAEVAEFEDA